MDKEELQRKVREEEDYIRCPKCSNSMTKFLSKNDKGVDDSVIARLLMVPEQKVKELYAEAVKLLKDNMEE